MKISKRVKDETGNKYGMLTVLSPHSVGKSDGSIAWLCKCDCGSVCVRMGTMLRNKMTTSCGCLKGDRISEKNHKNLIGYTIGKLTVISGTDKRNRHGRIWACRCECGTIKEYPSLYLTAGHIRSCGCLSTERISKYNKEVRLLPNNQAAKNTILYKYKHSAKKRGLNFEISKEEFEEIIEQNCHYCGIVPSSLCSISENSVILYNGVDRENNKRGYVKDNCVPCCTTCNMMKMAMGKDDFLKHIKRIADHQEAKFKLLPCKQGIKV